MRLAVVLKKGCRGGQLAPYGSVKISSYFKRQSPLFLDGTV